MEILAVKVRMPKQAQKLADTLRAIKGVKYAITSMSSTDKRYCLADIFYSLVAQF